MAKDSSGIDHLKDVSRDLFRNLGDSAIDRANDTVSGLTQKFTDLGEGNGSVKGKAVSKAGEAVAKGDNPVLGGLKGAASGVKDKVKEKITGGGGDSKGGKATKSTNIVETIDVGVPVRVAYNQWTEFGAFPSFMKKVENVEAQDENKIKFKAQIFLSHREWEATILEQVPDEKIVWRSQGQKGHVDGAVTFHEIGPNLTRILVVLEYYPQGLFEKTGNIWEAQGRRARAELRHFRRHVMTRTILEPEEVEGWRGTIEDGEVVESHEDAVEREEQEESEDYESEDQEAGQDEEGDAAQDEYDDAEEEPEGEDEAEYAEEEPEEEPEDEAEYAEEEPEGEAEEEEPEEEPEEEAEYAEEEPEGEAEEYEEEPEAEEEEYEEEPEAEEEPEDEAEYAEEEPEEESDEESDDAPAEQLRRSRRRRAG